MNECSSRSNVDAVPLVWVQSLFWISHFQCLSIHSLLHLDGRNGWIASWAKGSNLLPSCELGQGRHHMDSIYWAEISFTIGKRSHCTTSRVRTLTHRFHTNLAWAPEESIFQAKLSFQIGQSPKQHSSITRWPHYWRNVLVGVPWSGTMDFTCKIASGKIESRHLPR